MYVPFTAQHFTSLPLDRIRWRGFNLPRARNDHNNNNNNDACVMAVCVGKGITALIAEQQML